jgi:RNA polymerase sigma-70 factor (ECF subfamily)
VNSFDIGARIRGGDEGAFERLFRAHYVELCEFANRLVAAPDIAEELVQGVFARLWRDRERLEIRTSIRAYLYTAVRNTALNHLDRGRTERRHLELVRDAGTEAMDPEPDASSRLEAAETIAEVRRAIRRLPPRCREAVVLRWQHGLRHAEIAEVMGISIKGVENQLTRGMRALREVLGPRV